ncbi:MAG: hypothetical protein M1489_04200 [Firmicutes bacterium]|nr:hypothetical protein [Bacillota bacterium]
MNMVYFAELIFAAIAWLGVLFVVKPTRIKELWPCGILGAAVVFETWLLLQGLHLSWFKDGFLPIAGVPIGQLLWGAAAGIFVAALLPLEFGGKIFIAIISTLLSSGFGYLSEHITRDHVHSRYFSDTENMVLDFIMLSLFIWFAEGLFHNRIHQKEAISDQ